MIKPGYVVENVGALERTGIAVTLSYFIGEDSYGLFIGGRFIGVIPHAMADEVRAALEASRKAA